MSADDLLDMLIDHAYQHARTILIERRTGDQQLAPAWLTIGGDGAFTVTITPFSNDFEKDLVIAAMRKTMREQGVVAYSFVSEAWSASEPESYDPKRHGWPKDRPDRQEVVIAVASTRAVCIHATWLIKRDKRGRVTALEPQPDFDVTFGRFDDLLATSQ
jgi:hypothetical protein